MFTKEKESGPTPPHLFTGTQKDELDTLTIDEDLVIKTLKKLREDKSPGVDELSPRFLFMVQDAVVHPLQLIFNETLRTGVVPEDWKRANVTPIYKHGNRKKPSNYRPISLTSQVCKLFEMIVKDAIVEHLERHKLIFETQHGFRRGRSCLSNLLTFLEKATASMDKGIPMDVIFLDFAKAFDKVPHNRLISKLISHGIRGATLIGSNHG